MQNATRLSIYRLWKNSTDFGTTPAALLGFHNEWIAYQINTGVGEVGRWLHVQLNERDKNGKLKNKPKAVLQYRPKLIDNVDDLIRALGGNPQADTVDVATRN